MIAMQVYSSRESANIFKLSDRLPLTATIVTLDGRSWFVPMRGDRPVDEVKLVKQEQ
ncbi:hypothetical protein ACVDG8_002445 [Mesorhizobium sp. ORM8.1]